MKTISILTSDMTTPDMSMRNAVEFVNFCNESSGEEVFEIMNSFISALEEASKANESEYIESVVHIINKGFKYSSKQDNAMKYYYYGYYSHMQEVLIAKLSECLIQDQIRQVMSTKHATDILICLFTKGILRQKDLSEIIKINKSNLIRKINQLIECQLIRKQVGPKVVLYELTAKGYEYCRINGLGRIANEPKMDTRRIVYLRDNFKPAHSSENKVKNKKEDVWEIFEPVRQRNEFKIDYISKNTKHPQVHKALYDI